MLSIVKISEWPDQAMNEIVEEAAQNGFQFIGRLKADWRSGANRFSGDGEAFFGVYDGDQLVAVGGLNRQTADCGRVRRVYVLKARRRGGIGAQLIRHLLEFAAQHYQSVRLRTDTEAAARFYSALGFVRAERGGDADHQFEFYKPLSPMA